MLLRDELATSRIATSDTMREIWGDHGKKDLMASMWMIDSVDDSKIVSEKVTKAMLAT